MPTYTTVDDFTVYIRDQGVTDTTLISAALDTAEEMVNDFCQQSFYVASTAATRSYTPPRAGLDVLRIHACTTVTAVTEWGSTLASTVYQTEPANQVSWSGMTVPITQLRRYATTWAYDNGVPRITVTGTWGWAATPKSVVEATKIIAKDVLQQRNNNSGVAGFGEYGAIRVRMNPIAIDLLQPYRRSESFGVA